MVASGEKVALWSSQVSWSPRSEAWDELVRKQHKWTSEGLAGCPEAELF